MKRLLLALGIVALSSVASFAASYTWNGGSGDWSVAGNWTPGSGPPGPSDTATVSGGTVTVSADTNVGTLNLHGGTLNGGAVLTIGDVMNWTVGNMNSSGRTVIAPGAILNLSGGATKTMDQRTLENGGRVTWTGDGAFCFNTGSMFTNRPGAVFEAQNDATLAYCSGPGIPRFDNAGIFRKQLTPGITTVGLPFNNFGTGSVDVQSGTLLFTSTCNNHGTATLSANTTLRLASDGSASGIFVAPDTALVDFTGGSSYTINGGAQLNGDGLYRIGTTVIMDATLSVQNLDLYNNLNGAGEITIGSVMNWTVGGMGGSGRTIIAPGATLNVVSGSGFAVPTVSRALENGGRVQWTGNGGSFCFNGGSMFTNRPGAEFEAQCDATLQYCSGPGAPHFDNAGIFRKKLSTGTTTVGFSFNNYGTCSVDVQSGIVRLAGSYSPPAGASLDVTIGGLTPGTQFGQLQVTDNATLNGALNVSLANGFVPAVGDTFLVVNSGTRSGSFSSTSGLNLGGGLSLSLSYPPQGTLLTAVMLGIMPGTLPLGAAGAGYSQMLSGVNGVAPYSFAVTGGTLPPGLNLSPGGVLSGTPTTAGTFNFTVQVTDGAPNSAMANYTMQVLSCTLGGLFENLRAQWRADGNALDARGTSHGTLQNGASFAAGVVGQAFALDGVNDFVEIPDSPGVSITGAIAVAAWVRPYSISGNSEILSKYDTSVGSGASRQTSYLVQQHDGILDWQVYLNGISYRSVITTLPVLSVGVFHHVVCTFDPATQAMAIYVDGVAQATSLDGGSVTVSSIMDSTTPVRLGTIMPSSGVLVNFFSGRIDEVALFDRALSASEVTTLYNNPNSSCLDTPEFTTLSTLPNCRVGTPYWQALTALLGHTPYSFALTSGALPAGLTLSSAGLISGTPLLSGASTFAVTITDALGATAQREFTIAVNPQLPCVTIDGAWARWPGESAGVETINGFNGALFSDATYTPGIVGQAFLFDGVDDYFQASVPSLAVQQPGGSSDKNTTLEFWMRDEAPAPGGGTWVAGWGTFDVSSWGVFGIIVDGNQQIGIALGNGFVAPGPVAELGRWYHVAAVYEDGYAKLYVDGTLVASAAGAFAVNTGPVNIGRFPGGAFNNRLPFKGAVDEPTVFTRALSAAELRAIYDAGASGKCRSLNNTVPNSTCEIIAHTTSDPQIRVRGLAFNPLNEPVVTWLDPGLDDGGVMWTAHANGSWATPHHIRHEGLFSISGGQGFALREDGVPFFTYAVQNVYVGNDSYRTAVYLVDGSVQPEGPGSQLYYTGDISGGDSVLAFAPGANTPHWVFSGLLAAFYDGVPHPHFSPPYGDFVINTNGIPALFTSVGGSSYRMSRTFGAIDGPVIATGSRLAQVAGTVDGNDVFHSLVSGVTRDADWANGKMVYAKSADGTNWVFTDLGPGVDFVGSRAVGLAMNPNTGKPAIAYFRAGVLWYAGLVKGHWVQTAVGSYSGYGEQIQSARRGEIFRLAFDREGNPAIAVLDPSTQNLLLCRPAPLVRPPVAACKNITVYLDAAGQLTINGADVDGGSTADCGIVRSNVSPNSFTCANLGPNTVTLTIYDDCGQSASCEAIVTVRDNIVPVVSAAGPNAIIECPAVPVFTPPIATDNCPNPQVVEVSDVPTPGPCAGAYSRTKTWKAVDASVNESGTVSQTITVRDNTPPVLSAAPADVTVECNQLPAAPTITASDTCDANVTVMLSEARVDGSCPNSYQLRRTWSATDACGNNTSYTQTITVRDTTAPAISAAGANLTVDCPATPGFTPPTTTDICDASPSLVEVSDVTTAGACAGAYTRTKTWKAVDACGNESGTVSQTITVRDNTAPVLSATPADVTVQCDQVPAAPTITASDTCDANVTVQYAQARVDGNCANNYQLKRTWSATDACGNNASYTQTITVRDTTAPVISAAGADATIDCPATPLFAPPTSTDNCDPHPQVVEVGDVTAPGACAGAYSRTKTWKAVDACGNASGTVSQMITVRDNTAPVLTCPGSLTVECDRDVPAPNPNDLTVTDNCNPAPVVTHLSDVASGSCPKTILRTYRATDACGNVGTCAQTIIVRDTTAPILSDCANRGASAEPGHGSAMVDFTVTATDNCDGTVPATCTPGPGFFAVGQTVVHCEGVDRCANHGLCSFTVTVTQTSAAAGKCSFTQGFYGNANGKFNGTRSITLVGNLLAQGPLIVGKAGSRSLSIQPGDASLLQERLPAGGTPATLPNNGNQTLQTAVLPLGSKGKFANVFLGQTITLALNVRLSPALLSIGTASSFCTRGVLPGPDGLRGTSDDLLASDILTFTIPNSVRTALLNPSLGINNSTVQGLLELANRGLAGMPTASASLSDINNAVDAINRGFDNCRVLVDCATGTVIPDSFNNGFQSRSTLGTQGQAGFSPASGGSDNIRVRISNVDATKEPGEPDHAGEAGGKSVWWRWRASHSGPVILQTAGSSFDTMLAVYTGTALSNLVLVAGNDDPANGVVSEVTFQAEAGTEYQIAVDGFDGGCGTIVLSIITKRPRLCLPLRRTGVEVELSVDGAAGSVYTVEASTDLVDWTPVASLLNSDGMLRFADPGAAGAGQRFYRVIWEY